MGDGKKICQLNPPYVCKKLMVMFVIFIFCTDYSNVSIAVHSQASEFGKTEIRKNAFPKVSCTPI